MPVPARSASNALRLFDNVSPALNALSSEYDRREMRYHIFHLKGAGGAASVIVQVSLDGTNWSDLTTMTGASVIYRVTGEVLPFIRAKVANAGGNPITFIAYSAPEQGYFE